MTVMLKSDHLKIVRQIRRKFIFLHLLGIAILITSLSAQYLFRLERDLVMEAYGIAKRQFDAILAKQELITLMRSKPLSVGQALDIADIILSQREVPVPLVLAIISQESEFHPMAVSTKGARGLMQVMPLIFRTYVNSPLLKGQQQMYDPILNVRAGLSYLSEMKARYGEWRRVLRIYQAGPENADNKAYDWYVNAVMAKAKRYEKRQ